MAGNTEYNARGSVTEPGATFSEERDWERSTYRGLNNGTSIPPDFLEGVESIAAFLGWKARKVRYARETGALPIRVKSGIGLYAFKSEILAALKTPDTLVPKAHDKAH